MSSNFFSTLQGAPVFQIMNIVVLLISIISPFNNSYIPPEIQYLIAVVILYSAYKAITQSISYIRARPLPQADGKFVPFPIQGKWEPWKREVIEEEIEKSIRNHANKHILIVSPSGTGKSTMVNYLIPKHFPDYQILKFDSYESICEQVLFRLGEALENHHDRKVVHDLLRHLENSNYDEDVISAKIDEFFSSGFDGKHILLIFDQVERYFLRYDSASAEHRKRIELENRVVKSLLKKIAHRAEFRTVFSIRSEYIFGSLSSMFNINSNGDDIDNYVEFYFLWGVNYIDDKDVFYRLKEHVRSLFGGIKVAEKLFTISQIDNQTKANTFLLNMGGYLYEKLGSREDYKRRLESAHLDGDSLIDIYLDAAFEGLVSAVGPSDRTLFDAVLFAIANDNRVAGHACDLERIAGLCHFPLKDVEAVVRFMASTGMLDHEQEDGNLVYRLKHEKLADRVLKSDKLKINSSSVDGIRFLTENRAQTERLTVPRSFPHSIDNPFGSIGYFFVLIFVFYGIARLAAPEFVYALGRPVFEYVENIGIFSTFIRNPDQNYFRQPIYYAPLFIAHVAWVSYIDRVNRAYIQNVIRGLPAFVGKFLAPVGTFFGVVMSFSPELFVVPIVIVGVIFGLLMFYISFGLEFGGQARTSVRRWGGRTILNVITVLAISYGISFAGFLNIDASERALPYLTPQISVMAVLWFEAVIMLWFWGHIYPEQNTRNVWSAELALFDKGRIYGA